MIAFDFDGVIVDSEPLANRVLMRELAARGVTLTIERATALFTGVPLIDCIALIEREFGLALPSEFKADADAAMMARYGAELKPVPGIDAVLDALRVPYCIASGSTHAKIAAALDAVGLASCFAGRVYSTDDVARRKPHPDVYLHAAAAMGFKPAQCLAIEDSPTGIAAARAAGMPVLGLTGSFDAATLAAAGAEPVASHADLLRHPLFRRFAAAER
jgi:HAD superfamily hydrolase (TIGR01509 family)